MPIWGVLVGARREWGRILHMDIGPREGVLKGEGHNGTRGCTQKQPPGVGTPCCSPREDARGETEAQSVVLRAPGAARGTPSTLTFSLGWSTATSWCRRLLPGVIFRAAALCSPAFPAYPTGSRTPRGGHRAPRGSAQGRDRAAFLGTLLGGRGGGVHIPDNKSPLSFWHRNGFFRRAPSAAITRCALPSTGTAAGRRQRGARWRRTRPGSGSSSRGAQGAGGRCRR